MSLNPAKMSSLKSKLDLSETVAPTVKKAAVKRAPAKKAAAKRKK